MRKAGNNSEAGHGFEAWRQGYKLGTTLCNPDLLFLLVNADANITLQMDEYEGIEGTDSAVTVCSELLAGILERGVTVSLTTSDVTASAGECMTA